MTHLDSRLPRRIFPSSTAPLALIPEPSLANQPPQTPLRPPTLPPPQLANAPAIPQLTAQLGHSNFVESACFSADGRFVLIGSIDQTDRPWDTITGKVIKIFEGHSGPVWSVCFVLMGCAADRVSYKAEEYGQGLLPYALLEGMTNVGRFIEVPGIFKEVETRVPNLARGIGDIQKPQVASPVGSSIQIGEMGPS